MRQRKKRGKKKRYRRNKTRKANFQAAFVSCLKTVACSYAQLRSSNLFERRKQTHWAEERKRFRSFLKKVKSSKQFVSKFDLFRSEKTCFFFFFFFFSKRRFSPCFSLFFNVVFTEISMSQVIKIQAWRKGRRFGFRSRAGLRAFQASQVEDLPRPPFFFFEKNKN